MNAYYRPEPAFAHLMTWNFAQPRNLAVITLARVISGERTVLYVSHDEDDGGWQFLDGAAFAETDARVVGLGQMVDSDPTLADLADLPEGFVATRSSALDIWVRSRQS
jgi:hypothetical protein